MLYNGVPYTYLLKHKPTRTYYYGVRYANNCNPKDLWSTYFTSSKHVQKLITEHGKDSFDFEIRKIFVDANDARKWENRVLKRLRVTNRSDFINQTDNISISREAASSSNKGKTGKDHNRYGSKNVALSEFNKQFNKYRNNKPMLGRTGNKHPNFGKKRSAEAIATLKEEIQCPHCNKIGQRIGMQRWHFNNCKLIKE